MQRRLTMSGWALVGVALIAGCGQRASADLTDADRAAIAAAADSMAALANSGNLSGWGGFLTASAEQLPPNADAIVGHAAVVEAMKAFPPVSGVRLIQDEVDGTNELAFVKGRYEMTVTPPGAAPVADRGKYLEIWRKQPDGRWLIDRDMYSSSLPIPLPKP